MEAWGGAFKRLHCTTGGEGEGEETPSLIRAGSLCCFQGALAWFLWPTCACRGRVAPLSRGQTGECVLSGQVVAFLAGEVTPRAKGERLQSVQIYTGHVARDRKEDGGALFNCGGWDRDMNHTQSTALKSTSLWYTSVRKQLCIMTPPL